ncbi:LacI family DNA-binding transcriptional regulator [Paenibacillus sp. URB8-2]|uniref:LacI family DNA-binding transcriptional regulator n=1 Tax=Paenibacillus sp. URB8-2 TaxID=2741301 RepID=UPI0015BCB186|nr:LacI family DNA-binding transcriptional regulator [Paenibacillus sp. URB8-2]BCG60056.1 catabolite control protein A [Paenibacillus sp. URB8-2]
MSITIKDVALRANVSPATVSRVLNKSKPVSKAIREKVMKVVEELNFNPNSVARSLVMKESKLIGVLIPSIDNVFISRFVSVIEEEFFKHNYTTLLCNTRRDAGLEKDYLNLMKDKYVDGVLLMTSNPKPHHIEFFDNFPIPAVFAGHTDQTKRFASVNIDNYQAMYDAARYLIETGHRRIAFFGGPHIYGQVVERLSGYRQALADYGIEYEESLIFANDYDIEHGYENGMKLFPREDRPTAICCMSDMVAIGAIRAAEEHGLSVPEDISIMGFDDVYLAKSYRPPLTTIRQPIQEISVQAAQMLLQQIKEKEEYMKEKRFLPHDIIVRGSCMTVTG